MVSIDLLCPPEEGDKSQEISTTANEELVNSLVGAVKEIVDVQTDTANKLVEKMTEVINNNNINGDGDGDGDGDGNGDGNGEE